MANIKVLSAKVSPTNPRRFLCKLECGHETWVQLFTTKQKPKRPKTAHCYMCAAKSDAPSGEG